LQVSNTLSCFQCASAKRFNRPCAAHVTRRHARSAVTRQALPDFQSFMVRLVRHAARAEIAEWKRRLVEA
ncbi:hypothetical protein ACWERY_40560, partial [Streptomyces sp. NPDC004082]